MIQLGNKSNSGPNFKSKTIFRLRNDLRLSLVNLIDMSHSRDFVKQHGLTP
jgi:hypothetical protein